MSQQPLETQPPAKAANRRVLRWLAGGIALLALFGCMLVALAGALVVNTRAETRRAQTPAVMTPVSSATQPARVIIAQPAESADYGGRDYESAVLANVYTQVNPSVVNISVLVDPHATLPEAQIPPGISPGEFFEVTAGSGFVWDTEGHIVTNNHVVEGAELIQVTFSDGAMSVAEIVGRDLSSDLAVIKIDPAGYGLTPIRPGKMEDIYVGMRTIAIGNPFGLDGTLTSGIISALGRSIPAQQTFSIPGSIQTDAAINPGNSGGPLLNEAGELIGVNSQIRSDLRVNSGVGFAIPVNIVTRVVPALIEDGRYEHAYIGISGLTYSPICADELGLSKDLRGAIVVDVLRNTPAGRAGLRGGQGRLESAYPEICPQRAGGDIITAVNGEPVTKFDDVLYFLSNSASPGDTITLSVLRNGESREVEVVLSARPGRS